MLRNCRTKSVKMNSFTPVILLGLLALGYTIPLTTVTQFPQTADGSQPMPESDDEPEWSAIFRTESEGSATAEDETTTNQTDSSSGRVLRHSDTLTSSTVQPTQGSPVTSSPESEDEGTVKQGKDEETEESIMAAFEGSAEKEESHTTTTTVFTTAAAMEQHNPHGILSDSEGSTTTEAPNPLIFEIDLEDSATTDVQVIIEGSAIAEEQQITTTTEATTPHGNLIDLNSGRVLRHSDTLTSSTVQPTVTSSPEPEDEGTAKQGKDEETEESHTTTTTVSTTAAAMEQHNPHGILSDSEGSTTTEAPNPLIFEIDLEDSATTDVQVIIEGSAIAEEQQITTTTEATTPHGNLIDLNSGRVLRHSDTLTSSTVQPTVTSSPEPEDEGTAKQGKDEETEESHTTTTTVSTTAAAMEQHNPHGILSDSEGSTTTEAPNPLIFEIDLEDSATTDVQVIIEGSAIAEEQQITTTTEATTPHGNLIDLNSGRHSDILTSSTVQPTQGSAVTSSPESEDEGAAKQGEDEEPKESAMATFEGSAEKEESHITTTSANPIEENNAHGTEAPTTSEATTTRRVYPFLFFQLEFESTTVKELPTTDEATTNAAGSLSDSEGSATSEATTTTTTEATTTPSYRIDFHGFDGAEEQQTTTTTTEATTTPPYRIDFHGFDGAEEQQTTTTTTEATTTPSYRIDFHGFDGAEEQQTTTTTTEATTTPSYRIDFHGFDGAEEQQTTTTTTEATTTPSYRIDFHGFDGAEEQPITTTTEATTTGASILSNSEESETSEEQLTTPNEATTTTEATKPPVIVIDLEGSATNEELQITIDETTTTRPPIVEEEIQRLSRMSNLGTEVEENAENTVTPASEVVTTTPQDQVMPETDVQFQKKVTEMPKGHVTPDWIIILGFLVGVAVLVLLCVAIATKDKWNRPNQFNNTGITIQPADLHRAVELETFLHNEQPRENGKAEEYTVIPLDELPHSYSS